MAFIFSNPGRFIVADDLGIDRAINDGIFFALENKLIDGVSLMANGDAFEDAVSKIKILSDAKIGIHFVLVEEKPLVLKAFPKDHRAFFVKYILGLIKLDDIRRELTAQVNRCLSAGIRPSFINSHQHLHLLPGVLDVVIKLAKDFGIPYIRIVREPVSFSAGNFMRQGQLMFLNFLSGLARQKIKRSGLTCNDFFVGFINAGNFGSKDLQSAKELERIHSGDIIEVGCHPGFKSPVLFEKYPHWDYNWDKEIEVLKRKNDE